MKHDIKKAHLLMPVWGEAFREHFLNVCLPNYLTPGNLVGLAEQTEALFRVFTFAEDIPFLEAHPNFKKLRGVMEVEFCKLDSFLEDSDCKYNLMNESHIWGVRDANKVGAVIYFLLPDVVLSEGALTHCLAKVREGKRAVLSSGLMLSKDFFVPEFKERFLSDDGTAPAPARELAKLGVQHLHYYSKLHFTDNYRPLIFPNLYYWRVDENTVLTRQLHYYMMCAYPEKRDVLPVGTWDLDYMSQAIPSLRDYYLVQDSDEMITFEVSSDRKFDKSPKPEQASLAKLVDYYAKSPHIEKELIWKNIVFHGEEVPKSLSKLSQRADEFLYEFIYPSPKVLKREQEQESNKESRKAFASNLASILSKDFNLATLLGGKDGPFRTFFFLYNLPKRLSRSIRDADQQRHLIKADTEVIKVRLNSLQETVNTLSDRLEEKDQHANGAKPLNRVSSS